MKVRRQFSFYEIIYKPQMREPIMTAPTIKRLLSEARQCTLCKDQLPLGPRPILRIGGNCKLLIVGQAPGTRVHESGVPWDDPSGERLRDWLGLAKSVFYDDDKVAILPMGLCYPGKGKSGDLPPIPRCGPLWHGRIRPTLKKVQLTLLIGQYAQAYYLGDKRRKNLTETVKNWSEYLPSYLPLPHPSPRNNIWLRRNPWFDDAILPWLRRRIDELNICGQAT
jgi:uracil-DNA glycosylase